eukprot:s3147_g16.t2
MTTGLALPLRHKPSALDPDAWRSPRSQMESSATPLHSQALLGRGGHSRSPSPRPSVDFSIDPSPVARENVYGSAGAPKSPMHSDALCSARRHSPGNMAEPSPYTSVVTATPHSKATPLDASVSMRSDLLHASPRHSSSLSPRHSLHHRSSPNTPVTQEQMGSELAASSSKHSERAGHSSPMHSQVLMDLQRHSTSPRRSPVAMDVELSPSPSTVRHRLTIPDLPHRGEDSPGHRLSACMSEDFRPLNLQASPEASRSPYDRELDKFRPLSPQSSQRQQDDELERFRPLSPASKHRDLESSALENELDKFRPLSPESKRSTMDAEELAKLRMLSPESAESKRLRFSDETGGTGGRPRSSTKDSLATSALEEEEARQEELTQRLAMQIRNRSRSSSRASSVAASPQQMTRQVMGSRMSSRAQLSQMSLPGGEIFSDAYQYTMLPDFPQRAQVISSQQQLQIQQQLMQQQQLQQQLMQQQMLQQMPLQTQQSLQQFPTQRSIPQVQPSEIRHPQSLENSPMTRVAMPAQEDTAVVRRAQKSNLQTAPTIPLPSHDGASLAPYSTGELELEERLWQGQQRASVCSEASQATLAAMATQVVRPQTSPVLQPQLQPQVQPQVQAQVQAQVQQVQQIQPQIQQPLVQPQVQQPIIQPQAQPVVQQPVVQPQVQQPVAQQPEVQPVVQPQRAQAPVVDMQPRQERRWVAEEVRHQQEEDHPPRPQYPLQYPASPPQRQYNAFLQQFEEELPLPSRAQNFSYPQPLPQEQFEVPPPPPPVAAPIPEVAPAAPVTVPTQQTTPLQTMHSTSTISRTTPSPHSAGHGTGEARQRARASSEPRLQRTACTMTEGSTTSSNSKERIRALESELAKQSKWISALEGDLKTAESRAEQFQATGLAAQKEIEMTLSQLQASSSEVLTRNTRIKQLESKLLALESKTVQPKKMKHSSSEGSIRSSKLADLERQVETLVKHLKASKKDSSKDSQNSIRSDMSEELRVTERRRTREWQDRCEMLRRSLPERDSQDLHATRGRLRDAENKVQHLNAELAGMQQAQNIKQDAEVQKLKQQLQQLEVELMIRKERCSAAEAQLIDVTAELSDAKAARTRTLDQFKGIDSELEGARRRIANAEREVARAQGERMEVELKCRALQVECGNLKKELRDTKAALRALDLPHRSAICATARTDALIEAGSQFANLTDISTTSSVDTTPQRLKATLLRPSGNVALVEAKAERTAGALDEARRELKRSQKEAGSLRRELAVAVATAIAAKASDSPPSRRRQGVRLRIEQEAAERLALGVGPTIDA